MRNVFGNDWKEAKDPRFIRSVMSPVDYDELVREADGLDKNDPWFVEQLADFVVKTWDKMILLPEFMTDLRNDRDIRDTLMFDLKAYIVMAFYYEQLIAKPKFPNHTKCTRAFDSNFTYKIKRQEIMRKYNRKEFSCEKKQNGARFLSGFFPDSPKARVYSNLIDLGLVAALFSSSNPSKNPYLPSDRFSRFLPFAFLQSFRVAFLKRERIAEILHYWQTNDNVAEEKIQADVKLLAETISVEGVAVINQFSIERLTNMNFLIAMYNLIAADPRENLIQPNQRANTMFENWLTVPLLKTRLIILQKFKAGQLLSNYIYEIIPEFLKNKAIPFVYGTFCHLMSRANASIGKNEPFFKKIYENPDTAECVGNRYILFRYKEGNVLCPMVKFCISGKTELSNVLFDLIKKEKNVYFKNSLKKSGPFLANYNVLLKEYESEIKHSDHAKIIREKAEECTALYSKLRVARDAYKNAFSRAYISQYKQETERLKGEIYRLSEQYKNVAHEVKGFMPPAAVLILDLFQKFGIPYIPGTLEREDPNVMPFYEIDYADLQKQPNFVPSFSEFYKNMARFFDEETARQSELDFHNTLQVLFGRYKDFDEVMKKLEALREYSVLNPEIVTALDNVYNYYAPKKE